MKEFEIKIEGNKSIGLLLVILLTISIGILVMIMFQPLSEVKYKVDKNPIDVKLLSKLDSHKIDVQPLSEVKYKVKYKVDKNPIDVMVDRDVERLLDCWHNEKCNILKEHKTGKRWFEED